MFLHTNTMLAEALSSGTTTWGLVIWNNNIPVHVMKV